MTDANAGGFTLVEIIVSLAILLVVIGGVFQLMNPAYGVFELELERADMAQRMRVSVDAIFRDLVMAGAGAQVPAVAPFRRGTIDPDPAGTVFSDRISVLYVPADAPPGEAVTITYWTRSDPTAAPQLMKYDGRSTDLPAADYVSGLRFDYFDRAGQQLDIQQFADGPWLPDAVSAGRFDADLLAICRVRTTVRVSPTRLFAGGPLGDYEIGFDVAPRNLNLP